MKTIIVTANDANQRLDKFVRKYLASASLGMIYKLLRSKKIKVNAASAESNYLLQVNDIITIYLSDELLNKFNQKEVLISAKRDFDVIYEDNNILIVNKANGLVVHGEKNSLQAQILGYLHYNYSSNNGFVPSIAHRLDRNTSGIVVIGKTLAALQQLHFAFASSDLIVKKYLTLVIGRLTTKGVIEVSLLKDERTNIVFASDYGKKAITFYEPVTVFKKFTLLEVTIKTGRSHQIRSHLAHINFPILGDPKYGNNIINKKYNINQQMLHAVSIIFNFPVDSPLYYLNTKTFRAPLKGKVINFIKKLSK